MTELNDALRYGLDQLAKLRAARTEVLEILAQAQQAVRSAFGPHVSIELVEESEGFFETLGVTKRDADATRNITVLNIHSGERATIGTWRTTNSAFPVYIGSGTIQTGCSDKDALLSMLATLLADVSVVETIDLVARGGTR